MGFGKTPAYPRASSPARDVVEDLEDVFGWESSSLSSNNTHTSLTQPLSNCSLSNDDLFETGLSIRQSVGHNYLSSISSFSTLQNLSQDSYTSDTSTSSTLTPGSPGTSQGSWKSRPEDGELEDSFISPTDRYDSSSSVKAMLKCHAYTKEHYQTKTYARERQQFPLKERFQWIKKSNESPKLQISSKPSKPSKKNKLVMDSFYFPLNNQKSTNSDSDWNMDIDEDHWF